MVNVDAIVAGAGIWGCTVARRLSEAGRNAGAGEMGRGWMRERSRVCGWRMLMGFGGAGGYGLMGVA